MMSMDCSIPIIMDKKEARREIKTSVLEKKEQEVLSTRKSGSYSGNIYSGRSDEKLLREKDRHTFSIINQLVSGHTNLNVYKSTLNKIESPLCIKC